MKDKVTVEDFLKFNERFVGGATLKNLWEHHKEPVEISGHFTMLCRERGKYVPGTLREGFNIWTLTGREYLAQLMSYSDNETYEKIRDDRIRYVGFGSGFRPEVSSVDRLSDAIAYDDAGNFLASWASTSFPLTPSRTTVRYSRSFTELQLSVVGTVVLREAGLFTDGDPLDNWSRRSADDCRLVYAGNQAPCAYKSFEDLKKTQNFVLEVAWEVRF